MKLTLPIAAIFAFIACNKENRTGLDVNDGAIHFVAADEITKTHFGDKQGDKYPTYWTGNESVAVALNYAAAASGAVEASEDFKSASFTAALKDDASGSYSFCAVSPLAAFKDMSATNKRILLDIPAEQTPMTNSCDEAAQIIAAYTEPVASFPSEVSLSFKHLSAYGLMSVKNLDDKALVSSIKLTSSVPISSRVYWFPEEGRIQMHSSKSENYINLTTSSVDDVWFAIAPVDLSNTTMTIDVTTDKGVFSKEVTFPEGRTLVSGHIAQMSFDFSGVSPDVENEPVEPIELYEVWKENDKAVGVVFWVAEGGKSAKIVSLNRTSTTIAWSTVGEEYLGAGSKSDGAANTAALKQSSQANNIPMLDFCESLGEGWYWPATQELQTVFEAYNGTSFDNATNAVPANITAEEKASRAKFDALLTANGGTIMNEAGDSANGDGYWASQENSATEACYIRFGKRSYGKDGVKTKETRYGRCVKIVTR